MSDSHTPEKYDFIALNYHAISEDEQLKRARAFQERMQLRRTVRHFSSKPVPMAVIEDIVRTAGTAPSGANKQPWHYVVVTDPGLKSQIRAAAEKEERENYGRRFPESWLADLAPLGTDDSKPFLEEAPALVVAFRVDYELRADGSKGKHYYVSESAGLSAGFLIAALHNAGLVTVTHTPSPMGFLQRILQRPQNEKPFLLLPVGYPADDAMVPDITRKPLNEIMSLNPGVENDDER